MTERDEDREKRLAMEAKRPKKTLVGLGDAAIPAPRPHVATPVLQQNTFDEISELDIEPDLELAGPSEGEFSSEKTQVGSMAEMFKSDGPRHDGMFAGFDNLKNSPIPKPNPLPAAVVAPLQPPAKAEVVGAPGSNAHVASTPGAPPAGQPVSLIQNAVSPFTATEALPTPIFSQAQAAELRHAVPPPEGDFEAQKTEMLQSPYEFDAPVIKLHVLSGPVAGQEFFVSGMRTTVGRGEANSCMVGDVAMSRQHFEIVKNPDESYTLYDLQSVNGTALNGTRVKEADLFQGDRIEAGKSVFQFVMHGQITPPTRQRRVVPAMTSTMTGNFNAAPERGATVMANVTAPKSLMKLSTIITIVAGLMSAILLAIIVFMVMSSDKTSGPEPREVASQRYLKGVEAVREHDWDTAESLFVDAQKLDPKLDVSAQMARIKKERDAKAAYEQARTRFDAQQFDEAARLAALVPPDSVYHSEVQTYAKRPAMIAIDEVLLRAQDKVTAGDLEGARTLIQDIQSRVPDHLGASELLTRVEQIEADRKRQAEAEAAKLVQEEKTQTQTTASKTKLSDEDPFADVDDSGKSTATAPRVNFTEGFRLYKGREFDEAAAYFQSMAANASGASAERAKKTAEGIKEFKKIYADTNAAFSKKDWKAADKLITQARRTDSAVAGGRGYFDAELASKLAVTRANLGLAAFEKGDYAAAFKLQRDAEKQDASNDLVKQLRNKLLAESRSFYIKAVNARKSNPNEAAKLCRTIMSMIPESEGTWDKAQKLLQEL